MLIDRHLEHFRQSEAKLHQVIKDRAKAFHYTVEKGRIRFSDAVRAQHKALRESLGQFLMRSGVLAILGAPFIYAMIVPLVLLDLGLIIYQAVTFPIYRIQKVPRREYIAIDRQYLAYLNAFQKLNCVYCGYANGLLAWGRAIAGQTEAHFCPIKHARRTLGQHDSYWDFADYGDAQAWLKEQEARRAKRLGTGKGGQKG